MSLVELLAIHWKEWHGLSRTSQDEDGCPRPAGDLRNNAVGINQTFHFPKIIKINHLPSTLGRG